MCVSFTLIHFSENYIVVSRNKLLTQKSVRCSYIFYEVHKNYITYFYVSFFFSRKKYQLPEEIIPFFSLYM